MRLSGRLYPFVGLLRSAGCRFDSGAARFARWRGERDLDREWCGGLGREGCEGVGGRGYGGGYGFDVLDVSLAGVSTEQG
jgi:hypothetical protein